MTMPHPSPGGGLRTQNRSDNTATILWLRLSGAVISCTSTRDGKTGKRKLLVEIVIRVHRLDRQNPDKEHMCAEW